jgi:hypothetical protein
VTGIFQPELIGSTLAALLVLLLPGCALLSVLPARGAAQADRPAGTYFAALLANLADAAALSVAISALLGLWFFVVGLRLNAWLLAGLYAACMLVILVQVLRRGLLQWDRSKSLAFVLQVGLGVLLLVALVAWRFYQARDLALPAWVDSVHHALIVRAIGEYGGVPPTLAPYLSIPFYYHYGFHLVAALFGAVTNLPAAQSVLWLGQVINALIALSVYRVGYAIFPTHAEQGWLGRAAPRALLAALLVGFAFQMPAYYLSWGRYTLSAGLLVLGPAMAAAHELYVDSTNRPAAVRLVLLLAGLCMVHYLALLLISLLLLVLGLAGLLRAMHLEARRPVLRWRALPWALVLASLAGLLLAAPWLWRMFSYTLALLRATTRITLPDNAISDLAAWGKDFEYLVLMLGPRHSHVLLALAAVGLLFTLRKPALRVLAAWAGLLIVLDLPWGVSLGPFRPDHYAIVQFFPASLFLADLLFSGAAAAQQALRGPGRRWLSAGLLLAAAGGLLVWGLRETRSVLNSTTNFTNTSDVAALEWVKTNTPQTARFFINDTLWQGPVYRGVDGGYWLAPYAGRASQLPPSLYSMGDLAYRQQIADWAGRASRVKGCTPEFWDLMRDADLTYVYIRSGVGNLQPENLADCPRLRKVYQRAGVFIYEVIRP